MTEVRLSIKQKIFKKWQKCTTNKYKHRNQSITTYFVGLISFLNLVDIYLLKKHVAHNCFINKCLTILKMS